MADMDESDSDVEDILALYLYNKRRKARKRSHKYWVHDILLQRSQFGEYHHLVKQLFSHEDKFFQYFRMLPQTFNELHEKLKVDLTKEVTFWRKPIGSEERLAICLRFLATGDSYRTIAFSYRIGLQTVCKIISETCDAIWERLQPVYMPTPTRQHWEDTASGFLTQWQFPNCLGALDGKHVLIFAPRRSGSNFFNYKKSFSVVLLGLIDHRYCFLVVDIGSYGSNCDGGIFKKSQLGKKLGTETLDIPGDKPLPAFEETEPVPHVIVCDEAFPSGEHPVRPVPGKNLSEQQRIFNYRLSRARRVSENCFGILANRWRLYHRKIPLQPTSVDKVIKATCVLHNMLQMHGVPVPPPPQELDINTEQDLQDGVLREIQRVGGRPRKDAIAVRNTFMRYFVSNVGSVPWQHEYCFGHAS